MRCAQTQPTGKIANRPSGRAHQTSVANGCGGPSALVSSLEQAFSDAENSPAWLKERSQPYSKQRMRESTGKEHAFALRSNSSQGEAGALGFLCNPVFVCSCFAKRNELVAFSNLEIGRPLGHLAKVQAAPKITPPATIGLLSHSDAKNALCA